MHITTIWSHICWAGAWSEPRMHGMRSFSLPIAMGGVVQAHIQWPGNVSKAKN